MSFNRTFLEGYLGADPVLRVTGNGKVVGRFSLATTTKWTDDLGNPKEQTMWHNIVVWGEQAQRCEQYLAKGSRVFVEGTIRYRTYTDAQNITRWWTDVVTRRVIFLDRPNGGEVEETPQEEVPFDIPAEPVEGLP